MAQEQSDRHKGAFDYGNIVIKKENDSQDVDHTEEIPPPSVKTEISKEVKEGKMNYALSLIHPCFVDLHRCVNLQELSSCGHCKRPKLRRCVKGMKKENKSLGDADHVDDVNGNRIADTNPSTARNIMENEQQREHLLPDNSSTTSGTRIIKCMFRKNLPVKSSLRISIRNKKYENDRIEAIEAPCPLKKNKVHECKECGRAFTSNVNLKIHLRIHSGEKPYQCKECGKAFNQKGNFKAHLRIHSGEKPYQCKECGEAFTQKIHLKLHLRNHSGEIFVSFKKGDKNHL